MKKLFKNFKSKKEYKVEIVNDYNDETYTQCESKLQEKLLKDFFKQNPKLKLK